MDLVVELVPGAAPSGTGGVTTLDHEVADHSVEDGAVVVRAAARLTGTRVDVLLGTFRQPDEVLHRLRRVVLEQLDPDRPGIRVQNGDRHARAPHFSARSEAILPSVRSGSASAPKGAVCRLRHPHRGDWCRQEVGYVFGRRKAKTHGQLMRAELNEGFGHLYQAAAHAAGGMGATMGPKWDSAKGHLPPGIGKARNLAAHSLDTTMAAFAPLLEAARDGAVGATKKARKAKTK